MTDIDVKLNAWEQNFVQVIAVQGESEGRTINATLIDRTGQTDGTFNAESVDRPIDLTGTTVRLYCKKSDGKQTLSDGTITDAENGKASFVLPQQATAVAGNVSAQIYITKPDNSVLKVIGLTLNVLPSDLEQIESTDEFGSLVSALNRVEPAISGAEQAVTNANTAIDNINDKNQEMTTAESGRVTAESERVSAENTRKSNEDARKSAETERAAAESERASAESTRESQESSRADAESARDSAESARVTAENTRKTNEDARKTAETARASAESSRKTAETGRVSAESDRADAESARASAESTRQSNEQTRQTQESGRVSAENSRATAENQRQTNTQTAISNAETATTNANTAADRANAASDAVDDAVAGNLEPTINKKIVVSVGTPVGQVAGGIWEEPLVVGWDADESTGIVTYTAGASGAEPLKVNSDGTVDLGTIGDSWLSNVRPCLLKNGAVNYYLKKTGPLMYDYAHAESGAASDIESGADGDVMIEFPRKWYKIGMYTASDGHTHATCQFSDIPMGDGWCSNAWLNRNGNPVSKMYMPAYSGWIDADGKLRSLSGKTITVNTSCDQFRTAAEANGDGYEQLEFSKCQYLNCLLVMLTGSLNAQAAIGQGVSTASAPVITGTINDKPLIWGDQTGKTQVKVLGVESYWGDTWECVDGLLNMTGVYKYKNHAPYNSAGTGYSDAGTIDIDGDTYVGKMKASNDFGLLPSASAGSYDASPYKDYFWIDKGANCVAYHGGRWDGGSECGPWHWNLTNTSGHAYSTIAAALSYTPLT